MSLSQVFRGQMKAEASLIRVTEHPGHVSQPSILVAMADSLAAQSTTALY